VEAKVAAFKTWEFCSASRMASSRDKGAANAPFGRSAIKILLYLLKNMEASRIQSFD
jgi:hypothetical protein